MPQPKKGPRLASSPSHQRQMLSNMAVSLFEHERIRTTEAKAKMLRPFAERLITKAKCGSVHHRRQVLSVIEDRDITHKLFADIAPRFASRNGGYTRIMKLGPRNGDGAPMALIELVESATAAGAGDPGASETRRRRIRRPRRRGGGEAAAGSAGVSDEEQRPVMVPDEADTSEDAEVTDVGDEVEEASEEELGKS
jgi:large subunit ribosomal protein L17